MAHSVPFVRRDPLIIGAGPAGTAAAITLARHGLHPVLIERTAAPTDKVCGDFLSIDTIRHVQNLGVDPASLGAVPIDRMRLIHHDRVAEAALPFPAFGLSRRALDAALLFHAKAAGAVVHEGQVVRGLTRARQDDGGLSWIARTGDRATFSADAVFLATGKHDIRDLPRQRPDASAIGMKMYLALAPGPSDILASATELTLFPGGYAGLQRVEHGRAVLCVAARQAAFQAYGGTWRGLIAAIQQRSRRFAAMLVDARELLPRPLAVAGIPYGYQARPGVADGLFRVGDQAAVIPSLTGDGMAIGLHSGSTAATTWLNGGDSVDYQRALNRILGPRMRLAGLLHHAALAAQVQPAAVRIAARFPGLLRQAARYTRLPLPR